MQFPEIAYSSLTLHTVPWTFMKFNELACSFMSNNSLIHFYKKFQLLWTERCERCETSIVKSTRLSCCSSFKSLCINQSSNSCWVLDPPKTLFQLDSNTLEQSPHIVSTKYSTITDRCSESLLFLFWSPMFCVCGFKSCSFLLWHNVDFVTMCYFRGGGSDRETEVLIMSVMSSMASASRQG